MLGESECKVCGGRFQKVNAKHAICSEECRKTIYKPSEYELTCIVCGIRFVGNMPHIVTCSEYCRQNRTYDVSCPECGIETVENKPGNRLCDECKEARKEARKVARSEQKLASEAENENRIESNLDGDRIVFDGKAADGWKLGGFNHKVRLAIIKRDGFACYICGRDTNLHVHHIIPRADGGSNNPNNLVTLCSGCHRSVESGNIEKAIVSCVGRAVNR